jgi:glycerol-3-phosphate cytidylyltransferase-like family protein
MKKLVIIPGGFHPFHAGHMALYDAARAAFPSADIYVAATADTSTRKFPFEIKEKLARLSGIPAHRFIQVKNPFRAEEITQHFDPNETQLIFVRSEKDRNEQPQAGGVKKDGTKSYLQQYKRSGMQPMSQHGYMAYLPVVQFGPGMTSATEIRAKWPEMTPDQKGRLVNALYPQTQDNDKLTTVTIKLIDAGMGTNSKKPAVKPVGEDQGNGQLLAKTLALTPTGPASDTVDEATLVNNPERGVEIRPTGGLGSYSEDALKASLVRQLMDIAGMLKSGNYRGVEYVLYKGGVVQSKIQALARLEDFNAKQGRRPIAKGKEVDIGENTDYIDEVAYQKT